VKKKFHPKQKKKLLHYLFPFLGSIFIAGLVITLLIVFVLQKKQLVCANSISCVKNLNIAVENGATGIFLNQTVQPPPITLSLADTKPVVLGDSTTTGEKHIYVDLNNQMLSAYQGDTLFMQTPVSTGKWNRTPTGDFRIWVKLRATRMSGGSGADYYNLPNVPYTMFFSNSTVPASAGFSLHGAYWHNNFGHPMSHGCVNMRIIDAEKLYNWADPATTGYTTHATTSNPGTLVTIYGVAPN
jgi:hypothetical protein